MLWWFEIWDLGLVSRLAGLYARSSGIPKGEPKQSRRGLGPEMARASKREKQRNGKAPQYQHHLMNINCQALNGITLKHPPFVGTLVNLSGAALQRCLGCGLASR